jgi:signal transduction histidine kinase
LLPVFVRRAVIRVLTGGLICALLVGAVGWIGERLHLGDDLADARAHVAEDVQRQFATLFARLESAVNSVAAAPTIVSAVETRDGSGIRALFARTAAVNSAIGDDSLATTVYGLGGQPIAWSGRPAAIPIPRLSGPDALFLAPSSPTGLRLIRVRPVLDPANGDRRVATVVAEAVLPSRGAAPADMNEFLLDTAVVPVPLRTRFEGALDARDDAIVVRSPDGESIAVVDVPAADVEAAHARWRARTAASEIVVVAGVLLLLAGPLLDWRRVVRRVSAHVALTLGILSLLLTARVLLWIALRAGGDEPAALVPESAAGPYWVALASPLDFLFTALLVGGIVALVASSFEQWRQSRRMPLRVVGLNSPGRLALMIAAQIAAGVLVGLFIVGFEAFIRVRLSESSVDVLHFSLYPLDPNRLPVVAGLVVVQAALAALAVLVLRLAASPFVVGLNQRWIRWLIPILWAAPALLVLQEAFGEWDRPPLLQAMLVVVFAMVAAWQLRRVRARLAHASQAARLGALFVALTLPSLVFYPSLVDAAGRARRQFVETQYAPEVINQRRNLQNQLTRAQLQIDRVDDLADLVLAAEPVLDGAPPSTEAAYRVWSQTILAAQRLTSSVELYDEAGALVSRFALKLPELGAPQTWQEASCDWEVFEEVSPFFAEERRLLHAGKGICVPGRGGNGTIVGSVVVHVQLDYSNLSFISAQSPYVALLRGPGQPVTTELFPRERLEFAVYGWSRRTLYMSGDDAWPLEEPVFQRILASRDPFWVELARADTVYEVYFLNDRGGIYALGYRRTSAIDHLVTIAELVVLAVVIMLLLLAAGALYGSIATRTPASGRALLREVRASFYRKLFIAFVIAAVLPVLALAFVSREYIANLINADVEREAMRTAASASRVVEDFGSLEVRGEANLQVPDDNLVVWLSRVIAQDVNIFEGPELLASSERNLFASRLLPTRTPGEVYRAIVLEGRPTFVYRESVGGYQYLVAAAPLGVQNRDAILTVPLTLRQQELQAQIDELDRRVLLAAVLFIIFGAGIGYRMAERIADPVNRLMKATARIRRGDLDARILQTSSDEFRRLVESFNRMASDLQRQRVELERTNRLAAWADMARQVAHDIKNPLTPIQLNAEHLRRVHKDRGEPLGKVLDECVSNILKQVRLLRQLSSEFSSFASAPTPRPAPTSLSELVTEVIGPYRAGLTERILVDIEVPAALPALFVDKTLLSRALTNVIENALHAMPSGGTLRITAKGADDHVDLAVSDTGIGMDRDALARIFEPYFSTRAAGTGLGLTIAKRNVELNNGSIEVQSERGVGTTVTLRLPAAAHPPRDA